MTYRLLNDSPVEPTTYARREVRTRIRNNINSANARPSRRHTTMNRRSVARIMASMGVAIRDAFRTDDMASLIGTAYTHIGANWVDLCTTLQDKFNVFPCESCNEFHHEDSSSSTEDGGEVCEACIEIHYNYSECMDTHIHSDNTVSVYSSRRCYDCASRNYIDQSDNILWSDYYQQYQFRDYFDSLSENFDEESDECDKGYLGGMSPFDWRNTAICEYHSSKHVIEFIPGSKYASLKPAVNVGIELEVESRGGDRYECAAEIKRMLNDGVNYCLCEEDGSLSDDHGFEIVTGYTGLDVHERILSKLKTPEFSKLKRDFGLVSHDTNSCGLHVTIDRAGMTPLHLGKMVVFMNLPDNRKLVEAVCRRYQTNYARIKAEKVKIRREESEDRYEIINTTKRDVLEFRGPKGTLRFESIMAAMQFIRLAWFFARDASACDLSTRAFIAFASKPENLMETTYLRQILTEKGLIAPLPVPTTRRLNITESFRDAAVMGFIRQPSMADS